MQPANEENRQAQDGADVRYLLFLVRAGEILGLSLDYEETLGNVCAAAVETVADICILDLGREKELEMVAAAHRLPGRSAQIRRAGEFLRRCDGFPVHPACTVVDTGASILVPDVDDAYILASATSEEHGDFMREMGYRSLIVVPVVSHVQGILGALTLVRTRDSNERYDGRALLFAEDLGRRCGTAIAKSKLYSQSVDVATRLQRSSLPRVLPARAGVAFDAYYEPAEAQMLIGGDWYDAFNLPDGRIGISMGDVTGHGVDAAAFMHSIRDALRTALYGDTDLLRALNIADYLITEEFPEERYATALLSIYDPQTRELTCASAGHPGPFVYVPSKTGVIDPYLSRGLPLGMRGLVRFEQRIQSLTLERGSMTVYFTDGLLEWSRDYLQGERAVCEALMQPEIREARHPAKAIRNHVVRGQHNDDIAVLVLQVLE